ncbi:MarR family winged helix-turn-helix transcriptional regulator [Saccharospirillum alexandrii]|uniref:MarR family winged helix-turn-helix transcriptional regulator n=1 Tax=Saccharospirillum alexandrii TaxID=2448477 RepID=UPI000FD6BFC9|nr:MarR family transcriptional regulator [Saccharospirillum alexandrii]
MPDTRLLESSFRIAHTLKRQLHHHIEALDLDIVPMHIHVMKIIEQRSPCTAQGIAQFLERDKAQVTRLLNTLIDLKLIEKTPSPTDKRSQLLAFTEKGNRVMRQIDEVDEAIIEKMTRDLSAEDLESFYRVASHMSDNLCDDDGPEG